jgi:hypothetical protein
MIHVQGTDNRMELTQDTSRFDVEVRSEPITQAYGKMSILLLLSSYARPCGILQCDFILTAQSREVPETFSGGDYADVLKNLVTVEKFPYLHDVVASDAYTDEQAESPEISGTILTSGWNAF